MSLAFGQSEAIKSLPRNSEYSGPYRKSTQMGEESILRRSGEPRLRNSAKLFCNFGRKNPYFGRAQ